MPEQLSTIRDLVYDRIDVDPADPRVPAASVNRAINAALRKCATDFDPFWLVTTATLSTAAGTGSYATSTLANFHKLSRIEDPDYEDLTAIGPKEIARYQRFSTGRPVAYTIEGGNIKLGPVPDAVYNLSVVYYRTEEALATDQQSPLLPSHYTDYAVIHAGIILCTKLRDTSRRQDLLVDLRDEKERISNDMRQMKAMPRIRTRTEWSV